MTLQARRVRAWVALAAFTATLVVPFLNARHVFRVDDVACAVAAASDPAAARLSAAGAPAGADHCDLCHWLRAVGGAHVSNAALIGARWQPAAPSPAPVHRCPATPARCHGPARAPPSHLV